MPAVLAFEYVKTAGGLVRWGRTVGGGTPPPDFVLRTTRPTIGLASHGIIRPTDGTLTGDQTVGSGQFIKDKIINGNVTITGDGYIENCYVRGRTADATGVEFLVNTTNATGRAFADRTLENANIRYCTIQPQNPSSYRNGVGSKNWNIYRSTVLDCTDSLNAYAPSGGDGLCRCAVRGSYFARFSQFAPDTANNRDIGHCDHIQCQGNDTDDPYDIYSCGNSYNARPGPASTDPSRYEQIAVFMVSPNTQARVSFRSEDDWAEGGVYTINAGAANPGGVVHLIRPKMERPGVNTPGPDKAIVIDAATSRLVDDPRYLDNNAIVPVSAG